MRARSFPSTRGARSGRTVGAGGGMSGLLLLAGTILAGTAASFGLGAWCVTQPDPGADCALLLAVPTLVGLPLGAAAAIVGAARAGWLERWGDDEGASEEAGPTGGGLGPPGRGGSEAVKPRG